MTQKYYPIEDYGVIGDLYTVALVGPDGRIDFMSYPDFDSPTIFTALLDYNKGGYFQISPSSQVSREKKMYLPQTNVLLTRFLSVEGISEISDYMPAGRDEWAHIIVRNIKAVKGDQNFIMHCSPRFNYARQMPRIEPCKDGVIFSADGPHATAMRLYSTVPVTVRDGSVMAEFRLTSGQTASFILEPAATPVAATAGIDRFVEESFAQTVKFWRTWIASSQYVGRWREMVNRSALTLKLLTSKKHGSIVAAPTFGLPEVFGGERNWDYRYVWIRDASFTLYALMRLGFYDEAIAFTRWFEDRCEEASEGLPLQLMYRLNGGREMPEEVLGHLEGYLGSSPVRIGNEASKQLQLDIYGEMLDSLYIFDKYSNHISHDIWQHVCALTEQVIQNWKKPDEGIWEVRGGKHEFLLSRVMCWVAVDRTLRLAQRRSFPGDTERWRKVRDEIYHNIFKDFWNQERKAFIQHKGSKVVDASALLLPLMKFISPNDPRWLSTLGAIEHELVEETLVYRYRMGTAAPDGLTGEEGSFSPCSFWYAECVARTGDLEKARLCFEKMLGYSNRLGLYGEELGAGGEYLGNFPLAFTHVALISAAFDIDRRLNAAGVTI